MLEKRYAWIADLEKRGVLADISGPEKRRFETMGTPFLGQRAIYQRTPDYQEAALVTALRADGTVNLCVLRVNGETTNRTAVPVGEPQVNGGFYCTLEPDLKEELDVAHLAIGALSDKVDALGDALDKLSKPVVTSIFPTVVQEPPISPTLPTATVNDAPPVQIAE